MGDRGRPRVTIIDPLRLSPCFLFRNGMKNESEWRPPPGVSLLVPLYVNTYVQLPGMFSSELAEPSARRWGPPSHSTNSSVPNRWKRKAIRGPTRPISTLRLPLSPCYTVCRTVHTAAAQRNARNAAALHSPGALGRSLG